MASNGDQCSCCSHPVSNSSVVQTLSEMDFERGLQTFRLQYRLHLFLGILIYNQSNISVSEVVYSVVPTHPLQESGLQQWMGTWLGLSLCSKKAHILT